MEGRRGKASISPGKRCEKNLSTSRRKERSGSMHWDSTAKLKSLFHPATGEVQVKGVRSCANVVLPPWLKEQLTQ